MSEERSERLLRAIGGVGGDLIDMAEKRTFAGNPWRKWLPAAACLVLAIGLCAVAAPYLTNGEKSTSPTTSNTQLQQDTEDGIEAETETETKTGDVTETETTQQETQHIEITREEPGGGTNGTAVFGAASKSQVVVNEVIYYVEAVYTSEQAGQILADHLGQVEAATDSSLTGAEVYVRTGSAYGDAGTAAAPVEIFVEDGERYLYCLTYFSTNTPLLTAVQAELLCGLGFYEELRNSLVKPMELLYDGMPLEDFDGPAQLTSQQLEAFFLRILAMEREAGHRTGELDEYLWYRDDLAAYVIPVVDVTGMLAQYLQDFDFRPEQCASYQAAYDALVMTSLELEEAYIVHENAEACAYDPDSQTLTLSVNRYSTDDIKQIQCATRVYTIRLSEAGFTYESVVTTAETYLDSLADAYEDTVASDEAAAGPGEVQAEAEGKE